MKARTALSVAVFVAAAALPLAGGVALAGTDVQGPGIDVVTPTPAGFDPYGSMRLQAIGSIGNTPDELLGVTDLGTGAQRIEANFTVPRFLTNGNVGSATGDCRGNFVVGPSGTAVTNAISFSWNPAADTLVAVVANSSLGCTLTFGSFTTELMTAKGWSLAEAREALTKVNALQVVVDSRQVGASVALRDAVVDGSVALGTFAPGAGAAQGWLGTGYDYDAPNGFTVGGSLDLAGAFNACTSTCGLDLRFGHVPPDNEAPVVAQAAGDAAGHEGSTLQAAGSFTDPDGDLLTVTGSGVGAVTDLGGGAWSWAHSPTDDGAGTVTVTADDGNGATVADTFSWQAGNLAPTIVSLEPSTTTVLVGSDVMWTATATDPGSGDTHAWSFDDGLGSGAGLSTTFTRSYGSCGEFQLAATVADDDGGSATVTSSATVTVIGAQVLEPAADAAGRMVQRGQVVPLKVRVGCGDGNLGGLAPTVGLLAGGTEMAAWSSNGGPGVMRELDGMYVFNLRVPGAANGATLRSGDALVVTITPFGPGGGSLDLVLTIRR